MSLMQATCFIGTLYSCYLSFTLIKFVLSVLKTMLLGGSIEFRRYGSWAVVTGCTDGIGKEYARQLAAKGLNIVLMSRTKEKLEAVAVEIEKDYNVETKIIQVDFSGGHEIYDAVLKELDGLDIGVLVNNVGASVSFPEYFHDISVEVIWRQVNVNVMSCAMLTRMIIPSMLERKKGIIINVSSASGQFPMPLTGAYGATKSFVDRFSKNLHNEYNDKGLIIQNVFPFVVATKMSGVKRESLLTPFPETYVASVLGKVGVAKECFGYWPHELQAFITMLLPEWLQVKIVMNVSKRLRARALKKREAKKDS
ncbi:very-long-chain 3-oxoacyl-CoA reductase-like [Xenia sp. Carnegie-2017]|uniref:very-long-chain 3-oxoacyl-CoA reductase-like n=1 Tax=Xenia sp. Carnegie-2017 TaxID=2897299 RepID=UPI001F04BA01|nr:very-long-chain 3-oxoacyl-CoA reductase-like [Xenia sp. Carnegie-2017]